MKSKSSGILALLFILACVALAGAQVEPPYDPSILPQENAGQFTTIAVPEKIANSGAARLSYPIAVPPGRRGLAPRLALEYNSGAWTASKTPTAIITASPTSRIRGRFTRRGFPTPETAA